jgi:hypothetical protein
VPLFSGEAEKEGRSLEKRWLAFIEVRVSHLFSHGCLSILMNSHLFFWVKPVERWEQVEKEVAVHQNGQTATSFPLRATSFFTAAITVERQPPLHFVPPLFSSPCSQPTLSEFTLFLYQH